MIPLGYFLMKVHRTKCNLLSTMAMKRSHFERGIKIVTFAISEIEVATKTESCVLQQFSYCRPYWYMTVFVPLVEYCHLLPAWHAQLERPV